MSPRRRHRRSTRSPTARCTLAAVDLNKTFRVLVQLGRSSSRRSRATRSTSTRAPRRRWRPPSARSAASTAQYGVRPSSVAFSACPLPTTHRMSPVTPFKSQALEIKLPRRRGPPPRDLRFVEPPPCAVSADMAFAQWWISARVETARAPKRRGKSDGEPHARNQASSPLSSSTDAAPAVSKAGAPGPRWSAAADTRLAPADAKGEEHVRGRVRERRQSFRRELCGGVGHGVAGALGCSGVVERRPARRVRRLYRTVAPVVL